MPFCYILHSDSLNRYYIGSTILLSEQRLEGHLQGYYGKKKFTAKTKDWVLFFFIECKTIKQARRIEKHIKKMKSKKYIENLIKYPEISKLLLEKYK